MLHGWIKYKTSNFHSPSSGGAMKLREDCSLLTQVVYESLANESAAELVQHVSSLKSGTTSTNVDRRPSDPSSTFVGRPGSPVSGVLDS